MKHWSCLKYLLRQLVANNIYKIGFIIFDSKWGWNNLRRSYHYLLLYFDATGIFILLSDCVYLSNAPIKQKREDMRSHLEEENDYIDELFRSSGTIPSGESNFPAGYGKRSWATSQNYEGGRVRRQPFNFSRETDAATITRPRSIVVDINPKVTFSMPIDLLYLNSCSLTSNQISFPWTLFPRRAPAVVHSGQTEERLENEEERYS